MTCKSEQGKEGERERRERRKKEKKKVLRAIRDRMEREKEKRERRDESKVIAVLFLLDISNGHITVDHPLHPHTEHFVLLSLLDVQNKRPHMDFVSAPVNLLLGLPHSLSLTLYVSNLLATITSGDKFSLLY